MGLFSTLKDTLFGDEGECGPPPGFLRIPRLHTLFPYEGYDPRTKLFLNKDATGFVLLASPLVGASLKDQGQMADFFRQEQHLAEGTSLQFLLYASPNIGSHLGYWKKSRQGPTYQKLVERRASLFESKAFSDEGDGVIRDYRVLVSYTVPRQRLQRLEQEDLLECRRALQSALEVIGMPSEVLDASGLYRKYVLFLKGKGRVLFPEPVSWNEHESLSKQILSPDASFEVRPDGVLLSDGQTLVKTFLPKSSPPVWALGHMDRFLGDLLEPHQGIPCPFFLHYGFFVEQGQSKARLKAGARRESLEGALQNRMTKWLPDLHDQYAESSEVMTQIQKGERMILSTFHVTTFCTQEERPLVEQKLRQIWTGCGWQLASPVYDHFPLFLSSLPMMGTLGQERGLSCRVTGYGPALHAMGRAKKTLTREAQNMLPILGEWKGQLSPGLLLTGRRGQIFFWNPFGRALLSGAGGAQTNHNYNICIAGQTGSGKSVFMNEIMTTLLGVGGKVFVLDMGRSFKKTCALLGGQHIEFSMGSSLVLNPFTHIPKGLESEAIKDREDMLSTLKPIVQVMAAPKNGTNDLQNAYLEQAIRSAWEKKGPRATITDIQKALQERSEPAAQDLAQMLYSFTKNGIYGRFFEGEAKADFSSDLVVIETDDLRNHPDLMAVVVQMMILQINQRMAKGDRSTPFAIIIDEAWKLLSGKDSAPFIAESTRTARKYKGSIILGTQHLTDYFREESPAANEAFKCAAWKCILYQERDVVESLKDHPHLKSFVGTEWQEELLASVHAKVPHYSEVMIYGPEVNGVIGRLRLDPFSRLLYSTNPDEYGAIEKLLEQGLSVEEAIDAFLKERAG